MDFLEKYSEKPISTQNSMDQFNIKNKKKNIFISAIYEYPDGETAAFEENKSLTLVQLGSILDEGLGDNVLLSLIEL